MKLCEFCNKKEAEFHLITPYLRLPRTNISTEKYHSANVCKYPDMLIRYCEDCLKNNLVIEELTE